MTVDALKESASRLAEDAEFLSQGLKGLVEQVGEAGTRAALEGGGSAIDPTIAGMTVFVLACFVGYYVVWKVTPALHSPLMGVTNAISSVIIVGALIATGPTLFDGSKVMGFLAVTLASVNIFGGFIVTHRMLSMFKKKK